MGLKRTKVNFIKAISQQGIKMSMLKLTIMVTGLFIFNLGFAGTEAASIKENKEKDINMVPQSKRNHDFLRRGGYGLNFKFTPGKKYFISVKVKLNKASTSPSPRLRLVARYIKTSSGKFNYKWGDFQNLKSDDYVTFTMMYEAKPDRKNTVMIILNPKGFSKGDIGCFRDFVVTEVPDELEL